MNEEQKYNKNMDIKKQSVNAVKAIPTEKQIKFMNWEFGVFFHFGIRSFFPGHKDWDGREMPASQFNPAQLDCDQWIRTIRDAGAKYAILTTKHHDGFANWPSKYTDYSVANTTWKNGKGDVVAEYVAACRKYCIGVGLYYSPAQWGGGKNLSFRKGADAETEYDDYFINQISELLTDYGKIDYLWFDGCGSENHTYDRTRITAAIRRLQPDIMIFSMWDPDTVWVGNEDGYADMPNLYVRTDSGSKAGAWVTEGARFLPPECDFKMRSTWFDCEDNEDTIKSVDELVGIYELSAGRGANFLINIGPDSRGLLPEPDAERLLEFGGEIKRRYGKSVEGFGDIQKNVEKVGCYYIAAEQSRMVNRVVLQEDLANGQSITEFSLYAHLPVYKNKRICLYRGLTIGHKFICSFPAVRTAKLVLEVAGNEGGHSITGMKPYYV